MKSGRDTSTGRGYTGNTVSSGDFTGETTVSEGGSSGRGSTEEFSVDGTRVGGRLFFVLLLRDTGCPLYIWGVGREFLGGRDSERRGLKDTTKGKRLWLQRRQALRRD